jgi:hypothetical protein
MIKEEHRIDTITWLFISVISISLIAVFFISENMELREKNSLLVIEDKNNKHTIDSLKTTNDTLVNIIGLCEESMKLKEDEISFLGHTLDAHNIHPDYSKFTWE